MLALLGSAAGSLASCGLVVGPHVVGDAATDVTADQANKGAGGEDGMDAYRMDTGGMDGGRAGADVTMVDSLDAPVDATSDAGDAVAEGDGTASDVETSRVDADGGSTDAEAGVGCGQPIPTSAVFSNLVKTCVYVTSCDPYTLPVRLSDCIGNAALLAAGDPSPLSCLSKIANCDDYYDCQGIGVTTSAECSAGSTCIGNVAYDRFWRTATNCARIQGSYCQTFVDSRYNFARAGCVVSPSCTVPDGGGWQCSNNDIYECISIDGGSAGVGYGRSCASAQCLVARNSAACSFAGTGVCTSAGSSTCNGSTLQQACSLPNQEFNYDCAVAGGTCIASDAGASGCVSPPSGLQPGKLRF